MKAQYLETKRLVLRPPNNKDAAEVALHLSNPLISKTTLHIPYPYSRTDARMWIQRSKEAVKNFSAITFVIVLKKSNQIVGAIGLHPNTEHNRAEVGYWIAVPYWNRGLATEALHEILAYGFNELGFHKMYATHLLDNLSSGRVMIKAGMKREGKLTGHYKKGDEYVSVIQYGMTRKSFDQLFIRKKR